MTAPYFACRASSAFGRCVREDEHGGPHRAEPRGSAMVEWHDKPDGSRELSPRTQLALPGVT